MREGKLNSLQVFFALFPYLLPQFKALLWSGNLSCKEDQDPTWNVSLPCHTVRCTRQNHSISNVRLWLSEDQVLFFPLHMAPERQPRNSSGESADDARGRVQCCFPSCSYNGSGVRYKLVNRGGGIHSQGPSCPEPAFKNADKK